MEEGVNIGLNGMRYVFPLSEGVIRFKSLHDFSKALCAKLWWRFRTNVGSLWSLFMWNKYCKKVHSTIDKGAYGSTI